MVSRVLFLTRVKSDEQLRVRRELYKFGMQTQDGDRTDHHQEVFI